MGEIISRKGTYEVQLDNEKPKWFAVRTKYRAEKVVQKQFEIKEIDSFLPILKLTRLYKKKKKKVDLPLIPCYIFVKIVKNEYIKVLETEFVFNFVKFSNELISITDEEIELMKRISGENQSVEVLFDSIGIGDEVEILSGNLAGVSGKLASIKQKNKVIIEINSLGLSLLLEIDTQNLIKKNTTTVN